MSNRHWYQVGTLPLPRGAGDPVSVGPGSEGLVPWDQGIVRLWAWLWLGKTPLQCAGLPTRAGFLNL